MSIRFIYGRAGSGKSTYCIEEIKKQLDIQDNVEAKEHNREKRNLILLVPEQLSFQSEKKLIKTVGGLGIKNARVLSFKRMAHTVFKEVGGIAKKRMNSSGKSMLLYKIIDEIRDELKVFTSVSKQQGFLGVMSEIITEFKRYNITPQILNDTKENFIDDSLLYNKLFDIGKIYSKFEEVLHLGYIDSDDDMTLLCGKLDECAIFNDSEIWIDEFNGFIPQQYAIIEKLLKKAYRVNITINMSFEDSRLKLDETDVFSPIRYTENKLIDIAAKNGISIEKEVILNDKSCSRFRNNKDLSYLEQNYFKFPFKPYEFNVENINVFKALNVYNEIEDTAKDILSLCRDKGVRFNEIAVLCRNLENYEKVIKSVFSEYEIPHFIDQKKDITTNPLIILILSAVEVITKNWSYEAVFRYLKTGLVEIDIESIDLLENYVLEAGIKGKKKWTDDDLWYDRIILNHNLKELIKESFENIDSELLNDENLRELINAEEDYFNKIIELFVTNIDREDFKLINNEANEKVLYLINILNNISKINKARDKVITSLINFNRRVKGKHTTREITTALFEFLCEINVPQTIEVLINKFKSENNVELINEYGQIWNIIIELMDQIVEVMGEEKINLQQYVKILSIGFGEHKMGFIPTALDQVTVSSVDRMKSHEIKYVYLIGVNDGVFPAGINDEGILSDIDRNKLRESNIELAQDTKTQSFEEQFLIYTALTIAGEYLRVSYPIADFEGKTMRPSIVISRLKALFPKIIERSNIVAGDDNEEVMRLICSPIPTFNNLISTMREYTNNECINPLWIDVYRWFEDNPIWKVKLKEILNGFKYTNQVNKLSIDKTQKIYGYNQYYSISRLEKYNECPFEYFIRYGLKAKERKILNLTPPDLGTFMHNVIDKFSRNVDNSGLKWSQLDEEWCNKTVTDKVEECMGEVQGNIFSYSPKYRYFAERLKKVLSRTIWIIVQHMKKSGFEPMGYEIEFGNDNEGYPPIELELSTGDKIKLIGKIDRVDKLIFGDEQYFRIIDYKSGSKEFKLSDVYYGLQMQLLTYLDAILTNECNINNYPVFPAGVLYFKIDDPMIKTSKKLSGEEIEKEIMKALKMDGLVLADTEIVKEMDNEIKGASLIVPAYIKKDGTLGSNSRAATKQQFENLRQHVKRKLISACEDMLKGNIEIRPYKSKDKSPCSYCLYSSICEFDPLMNDNNYKIIKNKDDKEVWELIEKQRVNEEDGDKID